MQETPFPVGLAFAQAQARLAQVAAAARLAEESLPLARCHGRVLARDVHALQPLPPFDNSAMDGYACRHADLATAADGLHLVGEQFAGPARGLRLGPGECVRITTGAPLPEGADTIAIREQAQVVGERVQVPPDLPPGQYVRRAGDDCAAGARLLEAGTALSPAQVALAAAAGHAQLPMRQRPTVAVFTGGDELVSPGLPLQPGQIYDSNRELLLGLLRADGLDPVAWPPLPDDPARIASALADAASAFDVILTCGGASVGEKDLLPAHLRTHGQVHFWKVMMKPGMPVLAGLLGRAQFLGLPGNPVAVLATYLTLGRTLLDGLQGRAPRPRWSARLAAPAGKDHARREFLRGTLACAADGRLEIVPDTAATSSHRLRAAAAANALLVLPEGPQQLPAGAVVEVLPY
ncbi:molybdopterin molybdotransferase MoeA [Thermomonas flagellata]|uniref:molybdopterin molybdotransferase MoeA n=1 Tax=Thermomonas flagellata TaxID=2888524 RepID=UPI001F04CE83|nr:gephyrin-like molybdotransferase Glp [Thermomonas flagellata]